MSALFIREVTRRIIWIKVLLAFFPQHSETFHPYQYADRGAACPVELSPRWLAPHGVKSTPCHSFVLVRQTALSNSLLCICHASASPLAWASGGLAGNRSTVEVIGCMAVIAPIYHQSAELGPPKVTRLCIWRSVFRTFETLRVKVLCDPCHTACVI